MKRYYWILFIFIYFILFIYRCVFDVIKVVIAGVFLFFRCVVQVCYRCVCAGVLQVCVCAGVLQVCVVQVCCRRKGRKKEKRMKGRER